MCVHLVNEKGKEAKREMPKQEHVLLPICFGVAGANIVN